MKELNLIQLAVANLANKYDNGPKDVPSAQLLHDLWNELELLRDRVLKVA
jgi:hypothetical protein